MKLFLSWSGPISHKLAVTLRDWIPLVLQSVEPYVSSEDIDKGTRWSSDIAKELEESRYGIICVTHQNLKAPWINFEAGALSKTIEKSNVAPLLFNIKKSEVDGPLLQFQLTIDEKEDIRKLINSINNASDGFILDKIKLDKIFDQWWPNLEQSLLSLSSLCTVENPAPNLESSKIPETEANSKILEELLELARLQVKLLRNPEELFPPGYLLGIIREKPIRRSDDFTLIVKDLYRAYKRIYLLIPSFMDSPEGPKAEDIMNLIDGVKSLRGLIDHLYQLELDKKHQMNWLGD